MSYKNLPINREKLVSPSELREEIARKPALRKKLTDDIEALVKEYGLEGEKV